MHANHSPGEAHNLGTVGVDIIILICTQLQGRDILSLRQTCKSLEEVTRERTIWIDAARRACRDNALYQPSFDLTHMAIQEMEYLSMGVHRFNRLIQSATLEMPIHGESSRTRASPTQSPTLTPTRTSKIFLPVKVFSSQLQEMTLIRGGSFLVTLEEGGSLDIYDLSFLNKARSNESMNLLPRVSIDMGPYGRYLTTHASPNPDVWRILLTFGDMDDSASGPVYITETIDVNLSCDPPIVKRYGKITIPVLSRHGFVFPSIVGDDFAFSIGRQLTIGNCATKLFARWILPISPKKVILTDTDVLVISPSSCDPQELQASVLVYSRPSITPGSIALIGRQPQELTPDAVLPFPHHITPYVICRTIDDGQTADIAQTPWFDLAHTPSPVGYTRVRLPKGANGQYTLDIFPRSRSTIQNSYERSYDSFPDQRVYAGDGKLSRWWMRNGTYNVVCSLEDIFSSSGHVVDRAPSVTLLKWDKDGGLPPQDSFCAVSGRMVASDKLSPTTDGSGELRREVLVLDFL